MIIDEIIEAKRFFINKRQFLGCWMRNILDIKFLMVFL